MKNIKGAYHGKLLRINLTARSIKTEDIPEKILTGYVGGRGLGSKYLYDELMPKTDPLSKENKLFFATGPILGTNVPTSSRFSLVSKSPLTGAIACSSSGGHFGVDLKSTGYDMLAIEGKADTPCYLYIDENKAEIRDAKTLWGKNTQETVDILLSETDTKAGIACIGPAGENLLSLASVVNDKHHSLGRAGLGAVMGSKNLKAVVVFGNIKTTVPDKEIFNKANSQWRNFIGDAPLTKDVLKEFGTPALVKIINNCGGFATRNFQQGHFVDYDSISGETIKELYYDKSSPCKSCPIACSHLTKTETRSGKGPEFETVWALGPACGVNDLESIILGNYNCNETGIDTISAGATIACAMELSEKGFLDNETSELIKKDLGRELKFGDADAVVKLTKSAGTGEGSGKILGHGSLYLAKKCGHPETAMQVKGLELPAYDPRAFHGMSLSLATNPRGGCHLRAYLIGIEALATPVAVHRFTFDGKAGLNILYQNLTTIIDSMGACVFTSFALNPDHYANMLSAVTGLDIDTKTLLKTGERIWNLERLFNIREGFTRADDTLPDRILNEPFDEGHAKNKPLNLEPLLDEYYKLRGWSNEGIPGDLKKEELGL